MPEIAFWTWLAGFVVFAVAGALATIMDDDIDTKNIVWWKAALAYLFWPVTVVAVVGWAIIDRFSKR